MALKLVLRAVASIPIELDGIAPSATREKNLQQIEQLLVWQGNVQLPLAELFAVSGDPADNSIVLEGDCSGVQRIGAGLSDGTIHVEGSVGRHAGAEMTGGELTIDGSAGDWAGAHLQGGVIRIRGNAGNQLGGAYAGATRGMRGGAIFVHGDAGHEVGQRQRRGLIAVAGNAGDFVASQMLAGTVMILGRVGRCPGAGMRRGTLVMNGTQSHELLPTFRHACRYTPPFLPLLMRHLREAGFPYPADSAAAEVDLFSGDLLAGGRGEILLSI